MLKHVKIFSSLRNVEVNRLIITRNGSIIFIIVKVFTFFQFSNQHQQLQHDMQQQFLQVQQQQIPFNHVTGCADYFSSVLTHHPQQQMNDNASLLTQSQPQFHGGIVNSSNTTNFGAPPLNVSSSSTPLMYANAVTEIQTQNAIPTATAAMPTTTFDVTAFMQSVSNSIAQQKQQQSFQCTSSSDYVNKQQRNQKQQRQSPQKNTTVNQHQQPYSEIVSAVPNGLAGLLVVDSTPPPLRNPIFPSESINGSSALAKLVLSTTSAPMSSLITTTHSATPTASTLTANANSSDNLQEFWSSLQTHQQLIMDQQPMASIAKNNETEVKKHNSSTSNEELIFVSDEESKKTALAVSISSFSDAENKDDQSKAEQIATTTTTEIRPKGLSKNNAEYSEFFAFMSAGAENHLSNDTVAKCPADKEKTNYSSALSAGMTLIEGEGLKEDKTNNSVPTVEHN